MDRRRTPNILSGVTIALMVSSMCWFSYRSMATADESRETKTKLDDYKASQTEWAASVNAKLNKVDDKLEVIDGKLNQVIGRLINK